MVTRPLFLYLMKQAATLYHALTTDLRKTYDRHPAFAGRNTRFKIAVTLFLMIAIGIVSYSSTFFFS